MRSSVSAEHVCMRENGVNSWFKIRNILAKWFKAAWKHCDYRIEQFYIYLSIGCESINVLILMHEQSEWPGTFTASATATCALHSYQCNIHTQRVVNAIQVWKKVHTKSKATHTHTAECLEGSVELGFSFASILHFQRNLNFKIEWAVKLEVTLAMLPYAMGSFQNNSNDTSFMLPRTNFYAINTSILCKL